MNRRSSENSANWLTTCLMAFLSITIITPVTEAYLFGEVALSGLVLLIAFFASACLIGLIIVIALLITEAYDNPHTYAFAAVIASLILAPGTLACFVAGFHWSGFVMITLAMIALAVFPGREPLLWCLDYMLKWDEELEMKRQYRHEESLFRQTQRRQQARLS